MHVEFTFSHHRLNFVKQGSSIWLTCYSPVKPLTRIMKLDHLVKQMIWKRSSHTASYMYTIDN